MAEVPKAKPPEGKGKGLNAKVGGIPVWVIAVGVVAAIGVGLYIRSRSATAATQAAATPASGTDTTGGAGSAAASPPDLTPVEDLASAINGLTGILGAGGAGLPTGPPAPDTTTTTTTQPATQTTGPSDQQIFALANLVQAKQLPVSALSGISTDTAAGAYAASVAQQQAALLNTKAKSVASGVPAAIIPNQNAFGGIVSDTKSAAGVRIIKYASGRVVEQAPGKSAYVAKKGK